jgi:hypothetical protein
MGSVESTPPVCSLIHTIEPIINKLLNSKLQALRLNKSRKREIDNCEFPSVQDFLSFDRSRISSKKSLSSDDECDRSCLIPDWSIAHPPRSVGGERMVGYLCGVGHILP